MKTNKKGEQNFYGPLKSAFPLLLLGLLPCSGVFAANGNEASNDLVQLIQQDKKVTGTVVDNAGVPVIGASVVVKGTTNGTITDMDGKFSLSAPQGATLEISYIGYQTVVQKVGAQSTLSITLKEDSQALDEVVVVGYGTQKKSSLTGSIATIDSKALTKTRNENVVNMMSGKLPGVRVKQFGGEPGTFQTAFDIRGLGSPLIVINGIPSSNEEFNRINPVDIESMSVLKDGAAAIYGVKAANGVVLVTTKKGSSAKEGKVDINYSANFGWQYFLCNPTLTDAVEYMELRNEQKQRQQSFGSLGLSMPTPKYTDDEIQKYITGERRSTDWQDEYLKKFSPQQQHNLSLNGSNKNIDYYFNVGYMDMGGILKSGDMSYDRWNFRGNTTVRITDRLKAEVNLSGYMDEKYRTQWSTPHILSTLRGKSPRDYIFWNDDPLYPRSYGEGTPYYQTNAKIGGSENEFRKGFQGQLALEYKFKYVPGLKARAMYNYDMSNHLLKKTQMKAQMYNYDPASQVYSPQWVGRDNAMEYRYTPKDKKMLQLQLAYNHTFAEKHNVSGTLVYEELDNFWDNVQAFRKMPLPLYELFAGQADAQKGWSKGIGEDAKKSLIGRFTYDYMGKYLADFSFRYDGSSVFSPESRWGFFPSGSIGWRLSEESFIKDNVDFMQNLKVRASYGVMGDDSALAYQFMTGYTYPNYIFKDKTQLGYMFGGNFVSGTKSRGVPNPNLTWYKAKTFNIGVETSLFNGLLGGSFDYFVRNRDGLLATRAAQIPGTVGVGLPQENLNSDKSFGWEFTLTHHNQVNDFTYDLSFNMSSTRTMMKHFEQNPFRSSMEYWRGCQSDRYTNIWWGPKYGGQFTSYEQIKNHPVRTNDVPGDHWYVDWNDDGVVDGNDNVPIATKLIPLCNFAFNASASWKGFDVDLVFQGATDFFVEYHEQDRGPFVGGDNSRRRFMDRWHTKVPNANMYDPTTEWIPGEYPTTGSSDPEGRGEKGVKNATYLRLKTAEIGYTLPKEWLKPAHVQALRVFVSGYNLFTICGLPEYDPEHPGAGDPLSDWRKTSTYPINGSINVGANITF